MHQQKQDEAKEVNQIISIYTRYESCNSSKFQSKIWDVFDGKFDLDAQPQNPIPSEQQKEHKESQSDYGQSLISVLQSMTGDPKSQINDQVHSCEPPKLPQNITTKIFNDEMIELKSGRNFGKFSNKFIVGNAQNFLDDISLTKKSVSFIKRHLKKFEKKYKKNKSESPTKNADKNPNRTIENTKEIFLIGLLGAEDEAKELLKASYRTFRAMSLKHVMDATQLRKNRESLLEHLLRMKVQSLRCLNSSLILRRQIPKGN